MIQRPAELTEQQYAAYPVDEGEIPARTAWPQTKFVSALCWWALVAALSLPLVLAWPGPAAALAVAPSVFLAALAARWTFDSPSLRTTHRTGHKFAVPVVLPVVVGQAVVAGSAAVGGLSLSPPAVGVSASLCGGILWISTALRTAELRYLRASRRVYLIASAPQYRDVAREVWRHDGMTLVGFSNLDRLATGHVAPEPLLARVVQSGATMLVLSVDASRSELVCAAASRFNRMGFRVRDLNRFYERHFRKVPLSELTPSWFLYDIAEIHRPRLYGALKRVAEIAVASFMLVATAPLLIVITVLVRLSSPGPVLFRQKRVGKDDVPFTLLKFRTMVAPEREQDQGWATQHEARITRVGVLLRRFRVDELPQLWNVLRGQLSLIGPRPEQVGLARSLEASIKFYAARHSIRPGLTGWAQVNHGYGGSEAGTLEKLQYDLYYIRHQSLRLDLLIASKTARAMFGGLGR